MDWIKLNKILPCRLGYGYTPYPQEYNERVARVFGIEATDEIFPIIDQLLGKIDQLRLDWHTLKPDKSGTFAKDEVGRLYPELNATTLVAIEWAFTWWNR